MNNDINEHKIGELGHINKRQDPMRNNDPYSTSSIHKKHADSIIAEQ